MTTPVITEDYGATVSADTYISGIRVHIWLAAMYELMIQETLTQIRTRIASNPKQKITIYDLGCGPGHFTILLAERVAAELKSRASMVSIVGIDSSPSFVHFARKESLYMHPDAHLLICFVQSDVLDIQLEPADIVLVSGFIHHFPPSQQPVVIAKISSLLVDNGVFIHGDEHPAPDGWFEKKFPGEGYRLSTCTLYFQVIAAAHRTKSKELTEAETENFLTEVYRGQASAVPNVERQQLLSLVEECALRFMDDLFLVGLEKACRTHALPLFKKIEAAAVPGDTVHRFYDRGDYKVPLLQHVKMVQAAGLDLAAVYDTGNNPQLGSAPVTVFFKK